MIGALGCMIVVFASAEGSFVTHNRKAIVNHQIYLLNGEHCQARDLYFSACFLFFKDSHKKYSAKHKKNAPKSNKHSNYCDGLPSASDAESTEKAQIAHNCRSAYTCVLSLAERFVT